MRRHELPSPLLFCPYMGRLKLTAVGLIIFFAAPGRQHSHDRIVPVEVYLDLVVSIGGLRGRSGWFLTGESLCFVRHFAIRESKDEIVTPQTVKDRRILFDQRGRQLT